jgi:hypothetical protein
VANGLRINAQNQGIGHFFPQRIYGKNLKFFIRFGLMVKAKDPLDESDNYLSLTELLPFL